MSMRRIVPTLAAPLLVAAACAQGDHSSGTLTFFENDALRGLAAEYHTGSDTVQLATRRIVTEVDVADGIRTEQYVAVDSAASEFTVEVRLRDLQRGVELTARGDQISLDSHDAAVADKDRAIALFSEALYALDAADQPIPSAERQMVVELADAAATHPGFTDPVLEPYEDDQGCVGYADRPTFSATSVFATGRLECLKAGTYKASLCVKGEEHPLWWNWPEEMGCKETEKKDYDEPTDGNIVIDIPSIDVWCGDLGKDYTYQGIVKAVKDFHTWKALWIGDDWHDVGSSPLASHKCGIN
jgi:hypothetical protein